MVTFEVEYPQPILEAGIAAAPLIARPATWVNRRVETIRLLSHEETRRQVSIDFTLSDAQRSGLTIDHGVVVPISVMTKEARRNFDLRDESGSAVPVLGKESNGALAHVAVTSAALDALSDDVDENEFDLIWTELRKVVTLEPESSAAALGDFVDKAERGDAIRAQIWASTGCR